MEFSYKVVAIKKDSDKWKRAIKIAVEYAAKKGWTVKFHTKPDSIAIPSSKTILINNRHPTRVKYYVLLHELGHAMDLDSLLYVSPSEMHGPRYNTLVYRVERVKEEFDAWERGQSIAIKNGWIMDDYFYVVRAKFISSYMIWANNRKHPYGKRKHTNNIDSSDRGDSGGRSGDISSLSSNEDIRSDRSNEDNIIGQKTEK